MTMLNGEPVDTGIASTATAADSPSSTPASEPKYRNPMGLLLGVLGLVFAITFPPMGIILGAIAKVTSKRAGDRNPFATAAVIVGSVLTIVAVIGFGILIWFTVASATAGFDFCVNGEGDGTFLGTPISCA